MLDYLATSTNELGRLGWTFFSLQVLLLLAGVYLLLAVRDVHPVRAPLWKQLGIGLAVLGAVGIFLGIARLVNLGPLTLRWWFYLLALIEALAIGYAVYYQRVIYPQQMTTYRANSRGGRRPGPRPANSRSTAAARNGNEAPVAPSMPRPEGTTGRRSSRRDRKRRDK